MTMKNHNGMWLPDGDTFFQNRGDYERIDYEISRQYWQQQRCAIDIGAHCGYWTRRLVEDFDCVYAYEPVPAHYECLQQNVSAHNAQLHDHGLSNQSGELHMQLYTQNSGMSRIVDQQTNTTVRVERLDDIWPDQPLDFVKIDAENHEISVLQGAQYTIKTHLPVIFCEILDATDKSIQHFLEPMGYSCVRQHERNYIWSTL